MDILSQLVYFWMILINPICSLSLPNIALYKPAYQTSTYNGYGASKAVDGLKLDLSFRGGECAITLPGWNEALWRVDLQSISSIQNITIYYRTANVAWNASNGYTSAFLGFYVYISNTTEKDQGRLCFHDNGYYNRSTIPAVLTIDCVMHGRYVIYYNERKLGQPSFYSPDATADLCEVEIRGCPQGFYGNGCVTVCPENCFDNMCELNTGHCFKCDAGYKGPRCDSECDGNVYGQDCGNTCGSCINNIKCQHINGSCLQGCGPGYKGDKCEEECPSGKYGNDCKYYCSFTCDESNNCNKTTGECIGGCKPGWKGFFCEQKCDGGTYGQDCGYTCGACINNTQCQHINGSCLQGCSPGYQGDRCEEGCINGTYGNDCKNNCSITCIAVNRCTTTTGECVEGCKPGWKGIFCKHKCDGGMYGQGCSYTCGSCINTQCHHINGSCLQGCDPGYMGEMCNEVTSFKKRSEPCAEHTVFISAGVSLFVVIFGTILNIFIWKRNQRKLSNSKNTTHRHIPDKQENNNQSVYTELGVLEKQNTYDDIHHYTEASYGK